MKKMLLLLILIFAIPVLVSADSFLKFVGNGWEYKGCFLDVIDDDNIIEKALNSDLYKRAKEMEQKYSKLKYWNEYILWVPNSWCYGTDEALENRYNKFLIINYPDKIQKENDEVQVESNEDHLKQENTSISSDNGKAKDNENKSNQSEANNINNEKRDNNKIPNTNEKQEESIKESSELNQKEITSKNKLQTKQKPLLTTTTTQSNPENSNIKKL